MRLGLLIESVEGLTWERWRRLVEATERLGFESLWLSDHFLSLQDPARASIETWVALSVAAAETRRIRLGPLVSPMTFRHPSLLARMAVSVDRLSQGRLVLGLGAGWNDLEHRAFGLDFPPPAERMDRLEEGIEAIRRLFGPGPTSFEGRHYRLDGADPRPKPTRGRVPILIGGGGQRRTLPLVARYADEWDLPGGLSPDAFRAKNVRLDELCRAAGRDPRSVLRSASTAYLIARDDGEQRERIARLRSIMPALAGLDDEGMLAALRGEHWRIGNPDRLTADFRALAEAGAERIILQHNDQDDLEALELLAREVLPRVEAWT